MEQTHRDTHRVVSFPAEVAVDFEHEARAGRRAQAKRRRRALRLHPHVRRGGELGGDADRRANARAEVARAVLFLQGVGGARSIGMVWYDLRIVFCRYG